MIHAKIEKLQQTMLENTFKGIKNHASMATRNLQFECGYGFELF